jgi:hypothetical protein
VAHSKCIFPQSLVPVVDIDTGISHSSEAHLSKFVVELENELSRWHLGLLFGVIVGETTVAKLLSDLALPDCP